MKTIGILALQGAVTPHYAHLAALEGLERLAFCEVRAAADLENIAGLILPGGESSAMLRMMDYYDLIKPLAGFLKNKPAWGICAGAILLASEVLNPEQFSFGALPIRVTRNAYGRQLDSFHAPIMGYDVAFIRAPKIESLESNIKIVAEHDGAPVWLEQGHVMATTFHPELNPNVPSPMHRRFAEIVYSAR